MTKVDLSSLIADTQEIEKKNLSAFEAYMNQSTKLKESLSGENAQGQFVADVINNNLAGVNSSESLPDDTNAQKIWDILLDNADYMSALEKLDLPQSMAADKRLQALVTYMQDQLQSISDD